MYKYLFIFAPYIITATGLAVTLIRKKRDWWLIAALTLAALYFLTSASYMEPIKNATWAIIVDMVTKVTSLAVIPTITFWYLHEAYARKVKWVAYLVYLVPLFAGCIISTMYSIMGHAGSHSWEMYKAGVWTYSVCIIGEIAYIVVFCIRQIIYFYRHRPLTLHLQFMLHLIICYLILMLLGGACMFNGFPYHNNNPILSMVLSTMIAGDIFVMLYCHICDTLLGENRMLSDEATRSIAGRAPSIDQIKFETIMLVRRWCYRKGITEEMVVRELGTNRTYLSYMLQTYYGKSFNAWVMEHRIEHAKQILIEHPECKQAEVADLCGFADGSVFNRSFSKLVGMTPKEWTLTHRK